MLSISTSLHDWKVSSNLKIFCHMAHILHWENSCTISFGAQVRYPLNPLSTTVLWCTGDFRGALNCAPLMPRDASLSDSYKSVRQSFYTEKCFQLRVAPGVARDVIVGTWPAVLAFWVKIPPGKFRLKIHTEISTPDSIRINLNQKVFTIFWLSLNQTEFRSVQNQSENGK